MKAWLRALFSVSSLEQKGILALIIVIMVLLGANVWNAYHKPLHTVENDSMLIRDLRDFERQLVRADSILPDIDPELTQENRESYEVFLFDPNTASVGDLKRLGMSNHLIQNILKYRMHGGKFYDKEDLKKMYGMNADLYERIEPYITVINHRISKVTMTGGSFKRILVPIDINSADSVALIKLRGIGPVLSGRIIRYRKLLGGFYDTEQLKEVYGLPDSIISALKRNIYADTSVIVKINLNNASEKELAKHPYIGKYTARGIVRYRSEVQLIRTIEELSTNGLISSGNLKKLKKYLVI